MTELIFSIKDIFDDSSQDGCLAQYETKRYHIPAYQRGYKWGSEPNGAVSVLLDDLWHAFQAAKPVEKKEYYLQYITVKKGPVIVDGIQESCLEVIDGQQRLTTLSILISVLASLLGKENISADKLDYAIRDNFFSEYIYRKEAVESFVSKKWDEIQADSNLNKQDIFYLHAAARSSNSFFGSHKAELPQFYEFLLQSVKLIVNSVEPHIQSEEVFKNLNSKKIPLTETELIKALVITKVGRVGATAERKGFREVMESRLNLGRLWDEISRWANQPEIRTFYFNGNADGMRQLLTLTAGYLEGDGGKSGIGKDEKELPLFNFYNQSDIVSIYNALKDIHASLNDWFSNTKIYNLLGYCRFVKDSNNNNLAFLKKCLKCSDKPALKDYLDKMKEELLPQKSILNLRYSDEDNKSIHAVLLALSVFNKSDKATPVRFNFHEFVTKDWSLEHIFPQSPEGKKAVLDAPQKEAIKGMLGNELDESILQILDKQIRTDEEKQTYYRALQNDSKLNSIGNMCLLTGGDNSSNGCMFFKEKRFNMLELIQKGSFVPKHTFDVFSKMIPQLGDTDLNTWSGTDIDNHGEYISLTLSKQSPVS